MSLALGVAIVFTVACAKTQGQPYKWLTEAQEAALSNSVPPPPAQGSAEDKADLAAVVAAEKARTPAIIAQCEDDQRYSYTLFQSTYGTNLTLQTSPKFFQLLENVIAATRAVNEVAKNKYQRMRPYQAHPDVVTALFPVGQFSYPSGHAMGSYTLALVLGAVFPEKKQAFLDRAAEIAQSRVYAGVHYPSDIKEGEVLGKALGAAILANPAFQADLAEVQTELKIRLRGVEF